MSKTSNALSMCTYFRHHGFFASDREVCEELMSQHALIAELVMALEKVNAAMPFPVAAAVLSKAKEHQ